jgi:hypothetical protein
MKKGASLSVVFCRSLLTAIFSISLCMVFGGGLRSAVAETPAFVRIMHASPDIGVADVFLDGTRALSNFEFGTVTDYLAIPPGSHKVQVALIGKGPSAAVITQTLAVQPGFAYTVAAIGDQSTGLSLTVFKEDNTIVSGKAKVRFYHLSPESGSATISVNGNPLVEGLSYLKASDYQLLTPGQYTFGVSVSQDKASESMTLNVQANTITSIFTIGLLQRTPKLELISREVPGTPGLPATGSDPHAPTVTLPGSTTPLALWIGLILAGLAVSGGASALFLRPRPRR